MCVCGRKSEFISWQSVMRGRMRGWEYIYVLTVNEVFSEVLDAVAFGGRKHDFTNLLPGRYRVSIL